jgi:hypothetical protein
MVGSSSVNKKIRGRPKGSGRGSGTLIGTRFQPAELKSLDVWISPQSEPKPSRPEAIRRLVELSLAKPKR